MRARCESPMLWSRPAVLRGWTRVFAARVAAWGGGSVANVAPMDGGEVFGALYMLTPQELHRLDMFEGVAQGHYAKTPVAV
ncbi:unnamed protein product, partial [Phaeothamnion confervicola]